MRISRAIYEKLLRTLMFRMDAETAHHFALQMLQLPGMAVLLRLLLGTSSTDSVRTVFGLQFRNPVGLAAGFDKNAVALRAWEELGFGFVEAGTITAQGQPGNPSPRLFRLPEQQALINRLGFNNDGAEAVATRLDGLKRRGRWPRIPVGINIGKTKITPVEEAAQDYLCSFERLFPFADYFVLNVSSPNTPGLRALQAEKALDELASIIQASNAAQPSPKPVLVKIAPDLEDAQIALVLETVERHRLAGIIATNTTVDHSGVPEKLRTQGGLSGAPLRRRSTAMVRFIASKTSLPVIACGGICDVDSAREKLDAGASLLQVYTGFIYRGPGLIGEIARKIR